MNLETKMVRRTKMKVMARNGATPSCKISRENRDYIVTLKTESEESTSVCFCRKLFRNQVKNIH